MNILKSYRLIRPKKVKYPIPEIPDDSEKKSGTDWVLPKNFGSGRVSGTRQALLVTSYNTAVANDPEWIKMETQTQYTHYSHVSKHTRLGTLLCTNHIA